MLGDPIPNPLTYEYSCEESLFRTKNLDLKFLDYFEISSLANDDIDGDEIENNSIIASLHLTLTKGIYILMELEMHATMMQMVMGLFYIMKISAEQVTLTLKVYQMTTIWTRCQIVLMRMTTTMVI